MKALQTKSIDLTKLWIVTLIHPKNQNWKTRSEWWNHANTVQSEQKCEMGSILKRAAKSIWWEKKSALKCFLILENFPERIWCYAPPPILSCWCAVILSSLNIDGYKAVNQWDLSVHFITSCNASVASRYNFRQDPTFCNSNHCSYK